MTQGVDHVGLAVRELATTRDFFVNVHVSKSKWRWQGFASELDTIVRAPTNPALEESSGVDLTFRIWRMMNDKRRSRFSPTTKE